MTPPPDLSEVPTRDLIAMLHRALALFRQADLNAWRRTVGRRHPGGGSEPYYWQINAHIESRLAGLSRKPIRGAGR